jgi:plastocyanin
MRVTHFGLLALLSAAVLTACSGGGGGGGGTVPQFGTISGAVTAGGAGVAGANVAIAGGASTTTNAAGQFTLTNVAAGGRTVNVTLPAGFISAVQGGDATTVQVAANQTATASFQAVRGVIVTAAGTSFTPANVTIPAGGVVRWVNGGGTHTVTPDNAAQPGAWASADLPGGATFQHTFGAAATYAYHCAPHQAMGMNGTVTVTP